MENNQQAYKYFCHFKTLINYFKGDLMPFIHFNCRKTMTTGDIDGFIWDYQKKYYYVLEQKWKLEKNKKSQNDHLKFLASVLPIMLIHEDFKDYTIGVFKIIADPPFNDVKIIKINGKYDGPDICKENITQEKLKDFLNLNIKFEDL